MEQPPILLKTKNGDYGFLSDLHKEMLRIWVYYLREQLEEGNTVRDLTTVTREDLYTARPEFVANIELRRQHNAAQRVIKRFLRTLVRKQYPTTLNSGELDDQSMGSNNFYRMTVTSSKSTMLCHEERILTFEQ